MDIWPALSSIVAGIAATVMAILGFMIRNLITSTKSDISELRSGMAELRNDLDQRELEALKHYAALSDKFTTLHRDFIPRPEMEAILNGMREIMTRTEAEIRESTKRAESGIADINRKLDRFFLQSRD